ncbi:conserved exported hypothetical protein [Roseovarius sp. EC-HK134]|jgi:hypothetical protein|uniref:hypothetical protein n=1 Tax=unclassified Roseovarius TaxID=2614913 RepID=UPI0012570D5A|nr:MULTISPECIES: hypothetical protein [unclassified Roseovarius]VVT00699.1 conserved exported hypothetical protein [Roseovarius sp. EC-HK134]VVT01665.1 conserved exported hypothetical protein [Roseovarius sp. EC-SD190]
MYFPAKKHVLLFVTALAFAHIFLPKSSRAQSYPIDCAILLCLSGGWPASVPCSRARAEFIRRITPWPVEPPLQIWRCPMGATYEIEPRPRRTDRIFDALSPKDDSRPRQSFPASHHTPEAMTGAAVWRFDETSDELVPVDFALHLVQERADVDISGPEFNFVRSIRVFDVRFASQRLAGENDQCRRHALVYLGTYSTQGEFSWALSAPAALPDAHIGLEGWGSDCPNITNRSVFVDWRDYAGNYGFEQVNY